MTDATIYNYSDEIQGRGETFRYRCIFCGKTGRWYKDGNMADYALQAHQGDSRDRTPCPRLR